MSQVETLPLPFPTWQQGLLALADSMSDATRTNIILTRLESTARTIPPTVDDICALALFFPSRARFDSKLMPKSEPHPHAEAAGQILALNETFNNTMKEIMDAHEKVEHAREELIGRAFPKQDPRQILKDTIFGFPAVVLADVANRLGEADPFARLARRLSLWFKPYLEFSRYGLHYPTDGTKLTSISHLVELITADRSERLHRLLAISIGNFPVEPSEQGVREIASLVCQLPHNVVSGLDFVLGLEICGALLEELDSLDSATAKALIQSTISILNSLDDGRPATAILSSWLKGHTDDKDVLRLTYDLSQLFNSIAHSYSIEKELNDLLAVVIKHITQSGLSIFAFGPFPMRGSLFSREGALFDTLSDNAPEAAALHSLLSVDGDYGDTVGPIGEHWYWTGDGMGSDASIFPEVIDEARVRGDHALSDILISSWILLCALYYRVPLPDHFGLALRINALPQEHRSSTYAVLGSLRREARTNDQLRRDLETLLSWLPLIEETPPEDPNAFIQEVLSTPLWSLLDERERSRIVTCEQTFVELRRMDSVDRQPAKFRILIVDWSAVAESVLQRAFKAVSGTLYQGSKPLGELIHEFGGVVRNLRTTWTMKDRSRMFAALNALEVLKFLNQVNKQGVKHLTGEEITWENVAVVHSGIYWTLRALLDVLKTPPAGEN